MVKVGLNMLPKVLANELEPEGIHVNTIAPGLIQTEPRLDLEGRNQIV